MAPNGKLKIRRVAFPVSKATKLQNIFAFTIWHLGIFISSNVYYPFYVNFNNDYPSYCTPKQCKCYKLYAFIVSRWFYVSYFAYFYICYTYNSICFEEATQLIGLFDFVYWKLGILVLFVEFFPPTYELLSA